MKAIAGTIKFCTFAGISADFAETWLRCFVAEWAKEHSAPTSSHIINWLLFETDSETEPACRFD